MRRVGIDVVPIGELDSTDLAEARSRASLPRIQHRVESVRELGLINRPWVRETDGRIVCGFDRIATCIAASLESVEVELVDCTDAELLTVRSAENAQRRHEPGQAAEDLAAAVRAAEERFAAQLEQAPPEERREIGKKTAKGLAREAVAKEKGIKPASVRRAEVRQKKRQELKQLEVPLPERGPKFPTYGRKVKDEYMAGLELGDTLIAEAHNAVKRALGAITKLTDSGTPYSNAVLQRAYENVQDVSNYLGDLRPLCVCPWCKLIPSITPTCTMCRATGFITRRDKNSIPEELQRADTVAWNGKYVPIRDFDPGEEPEAPDTSEPTNEELEAAQGLDPTSFDDWSDAGDGL